MGGNKILINSDIQVEIFSENRQNIYNPIEYKLLSMCGILVSAIF